MAVIEFNKNPSPKELTWFGLLFALFFGIVGAVLYGRFQVPQAAYVTWSVAGAIAIAYYAFTPLQRPLYLAWMYAAYPIGWVISHTLLALIYYTVFTSVGLLLRLSGRDPMQRRFDRDASSYWLEHRPERDPARYFRQF